MRYGAMAAQASKEPWKCEAFFFFWCDNVRTRNLKICFFTKLMKILLLLAHSTAARSVDLVDLLLEPDGHEHQELKDQKQRSETPVIVSSSGPASTGLSVSPAAHVIQYHNLI